MPELFENIAFAHSVNRSVERNCAKLQKGIKNKQEKSRVVSQS